MNPFLLAFLGALSALALVLAGAYTFYAVKIKPMIAAQISNDATQLPGPPPPFPTSIGTIHWPSEPINVSGDGSFPVGDPLTKMVEAGGSFSTVAADTAPLTTAPIEGESFSAVVTTAAAPLEVAPVAPVAPAPSLPRAARIEANRTSGRMFDVLEGDVCPMCVRPWTHETEGHDRGLVIVHLCTEHGRGCPGCSTVRDQFEVFAARQGADLLPHESSELERLRKLSDAKPTEPTEPAGA